MFKGVAICIATILSFSIVDGNYVNPAPAKPAQPAKPVYAAPAQPAQPYYPQRVQRAPYNPAPQQYRMTAAPSKAPVFKDPKKQKFDQFWDNLALCDAEYDLKTCLLSSTKRSIFFKEKRIINCMTDFGRGLCKKIETTSNGKCDNGQVTIDKDNCRTAAFANALLVFNQVVSDLNEALRANPNFDQWSFATMKMALAATRSDSDCVTTSFFNYINQCAASKYISNENVQCVDNYLNNYKCSYAKEVGDRWSLPEFLNDIGLIEPSEFVEKMKKSYDTKSDADIYSAVKTLLGNVAEEKNSRQVRAMRYKHDHKLKTASIYTCPNKFKHFNNLYENQIIEGIPESQVAFHFPIDKEIKGTVSGEEVTVPVDPITNSSEIYDTCETYFDVTRAEWDEYYKTGDKKDKEPLKQTNMCFSVSGYELEHVETGKIKPLSWEKVSNYDYCFSASWNQVPSCSSHLTRWRMKTACCKSYANVQAEFQSEWKKINPSKKQPFYQYAQPTQAPAKYGRALLTPTSPVKYVTYNAYTPVEHKPIAAKIDKKRLMYHHYAISSKDKGSLGFGSRTYRFSNIYNIEKDAAAWLYKLKTGICKETKDNTNKIKGQYLSKLPVSKYANSIKQLCKYANEHKLIQPNVRALMQESVYTAPVNTKPAPVVDIEVYDPYVGSHYASKAVCESLEIKLDFNEIIPLISFSCHSQSCVLAQLASCMEIPQHKKFVGYDYVAPYYKQIYSKPQPQPSKGYGGASFMAEKVNDTHLALLGAGGFLVGLVAAFVVSQFIVSKNRYSSTTDAQFSQLV